MAFVKPSSGMKSMGGSSFSRHYTFVDYATQGYSLIVALLLLCFHNHTVPGWARLIAIHVALGLGIHALILSNARWSNPILGFLRHFYPVLLFIWFFAETGWINRMFFLNYIDEPFIRLENQIFGCQPSVVLMEKFPNLLLSEILYASYFSYYLTIGGVGIYLLYRSRDSFFHYVSVVSFVFYICYLLYVFFPIVGPPLFFNPVERQVLPPEFQAYGQHLIPEALRQGPFHQIIAWLYRMVDGPGAAFPSSHVAIAWTTVYFSFRYIPSIRYVHAFVAVLLTFSTVYCRYHYILDVVAGLLTAALLIPLANKLYFSFIKPGESGVQTPSGAGTRDQTARS